VTIRNLLPLPFAIALLASLPAGAADTAATQNSTFNITDYTSYKADGIGSVKFNALLQAWTVGNQTSTANDQNVRLRRSEFKLSGQIADAPKYFFMIDPAKLIAPPNGKSPSADNMVQDFGLSYAIVPGLEITAGQFKIPTTAEGLDSSGELPLPERSLVGRTLGDKREMGVKLGYKAAQFNVASMVSSGRSASGTGTGMFHDLDLRAELTPMKDTAIGSFVVLGKDVDYSQKGRWGLNARTRLGNTVLRGEFAQAKDGAVQAYGFTTEAGYWLTDDLEPVARYESFSPNQGATYLGQAETLGVNYFFRDYLTKVQVSGSVLQSMAAINGSPTYSAGAHNAEVTLALQTAL
jgi:hypothetical protein